MNNILETAVILIVILMIFGVILNSFEDTADKITKTTEVNNMEKLLEEICDNLINNPGTPDNWQEYESGTPGLSIINNDGNVVPNSVSYEKLIVLSNNYDKLITKKYFDSKIKTSIELKPLQSSISPLKIGDDVSGENIYSVNRLVKCDFYKKYVLKNFENEGKCNHGHSQKQASCNYFKIFRGNLKSSNYYLLIDDSEVHDISYIIDTTRVVKSRSWENPTSNCIYLNPLIDFYDDTSAVVFVHLDKANAKAVLISTPKNFNPQYLNYDYFKTNECEFRLTGCY